MGMAADVKVGASGKTHTNINPSTQRARTSLATIQPPFDDLDGTMPRLIRFLIMSKRGTHCTMTLCSAPRLFSEAGKDGMILVMAE